MSSPAETLAFAHTLADAARQAILPFFRAGHVPTENKASGGYDPVTEADTAAERAMRALIVKQRPEDGIEGEEFGLTHGGSGWRWVLDPIDGTRAFLAGTTTWGVLIGATLDGRPTVGIVDQPFTGERWSGSPEAANWHHRGQSSAIATRTNARLSAAILSTTDPFLFSTSEAAAFDRVRRSVRLCRYGLDCTAYALVAHGTIDCVIETGLKPYDICAWVPLIRAAGGVVTDWQGRPEPESGAVVASANPTLHAEVLKLLADSASPSR